MSTNENKRDFHDLFPIFFERQTVNVQGPLKEILESAKIKIPDRTTVVPSHSQTSWFSTENVLAYLEEFGVETLELRNVTEILESRMERIFSEQVEKLAKLRKQFKINGDSVQEQSIKAVSNQGKNAKSSETMYIRDFLGFGGTIKSFENYKIVNIVNERKALLAHRRVNHINSLPLSQNLFELTKSKDLYKAKLFTLPYQIGYTVLSSAKTKLQIGWNYFKKYFSPASWEPLYTGEAPVSALVVSLI